jgi:hypothetical protein
MHLLTLLSSHALKRNMDIPFCLCCVSSFVLRSNVIHCLQLRTSIGDARLPPLPVALTTAPAIATPVTLPAAGGSSGGAAADGTTVVSPFSAAAGTVPVPVRSEAGMQTDLDVYVTKEEAAAQVQATAAQAAAAMQAATAAAAAREQSLQQQMTVLQRQLAAQAQSLSQTQAQLSQTQAQLQQAQAAAAQAQQVAAAAQAQVRVCSLHLSAASPSMGCWALMHR